MTAKRFGISKIEFENDYDIWYVDKICDKGKILTDNEIVELLNELYEEKKYWKRQAEDRFERIRELEEMIE